MSTLVSALPRNGGVIVWFFAAVVCIVIAGLLVGFGLLGFLGFFGALLFLFFVRFPVLGLYATTALLLLSGSAGVIGFVSEEQTMAITLSKICGTAALFAWIIHLLGRRMRLAFNGPMLFVTAFVVWAAVSTALSPSRSDVFPEFVRLLTLLGYFLFAINVLNTPKKLHWFILIIAICGFIMSFVAIVQYIFPQYQITGAEAWRGLGAGTTDAAYVDPDSLRGEAAIRVSGRSGHSNWLALIVLMILPLNFYWYSVTRRRVVKAFIILTIALEAVTLILTFTRTGALIGGVLVVLVASKRFIRITPGKVVGALLAGLLIYSFLPSAYKERVLSPRQYSESQSIKSRAALNTAALRYTLENPLFGLGPGGFGTEFIGENNHTARTMKFMVEKVGWLPVFVGAHNMWLQMSSDTGFVGLILYLIFFVMMLVQLYRIEDRYRREGDKQGQALAATLAISLVGFLLCAVVLHALTQKIWWMIAAAAIALSIYRLRFGGELTRDYPQRVESAK